MNRPWKKLEKHSPGRFHSFHWCLRCYSFSIWYLSLDHRCPYNLSVTVCNLFTHETRRRSYELSFKRVCEMQIELKFGSVGSCRERGKLEYLKKKTSRSKGENQYKASTPGFECGPHCLDCWRWVLSPIRQPCPLKLTLKAPVFWKSSHLKWSILPAMLSRVEQVIMGVFFMYCAILWAASSTLSKSTSLSLDAIL